MTKKNFLFLSAAVVATTVAGLAFVVANGINNNAARQLTADSPAVEGSITFSKSTPRTKITSTKYSFLSQTESGTNIYCVYAGQGMGSTSQLGSMRNYEENNYIVFTLDPTKENEAAFQNITSISITTVNTTDTNNFKIYKSVSGSAVYTSGDSSGDGKTTTVTTEVAGASYIRITSADPTAWLDINSITITYSCYSGRTLTSIAPISPKRTYVVGDTFETPTVKAYYSVGGDEEITDFEISGYDTSVLGKQTVTITYKDKTATYVITVKPTATAEYINYQPYNYTVDALDPTGIDAENSTLPIFAEPGSPVTFHIVLNSGYVFYNWYFDDSEDEPWDQFVTDEDWAKLENDTLTINMVSFELTVMIVYGVAEQYNKNH